MTIIDQAITFGSQKGHNMITSLISSKVILTKDDWAITMTKDAPNNHARLIFEGVRSDDNSYFFRIGELCGDSQPNSWGNFLWRRSHIGDVTLSKKYSKDFFKKKFSLQSHTYCIHRIKIEEMIFHIKNESLMEIPFCIFGNKSFMSKQAEIFKIYDKTVSHIRCVDPQLFIRLYDSAKNDGRPTGMTKKQFDQKIDKAFKKIWLFNTEINRIGYHELIQRVDSNVKLSRRWQDSCFTWGRENLEHIGITFPHYRIEYFASVTSLYLKDTSQHAYTIKIQDEDQEIRHIGSLVNYDVNRDRRSEEKKNIQSKIRMCNIKEKIVSVVSTGALFAIPVVLMGLATPLALAIPTVTTLLPVLSVTLVPAEVFAVYSLFNKTDNVKSRILNEKNTLIAQEKLIR